MKKEKALNIIINRFNIYKTEFVDREILYWKNNISKKRLRKIERQYGTKINYLKAFENWENR